MGRIIVTDFDELKKLVRYGATCSGWCDLRLTGTCDCGEVDIQYQKLEKCLRYEQD